MKVVLAPVGTRGDVQPLLALGVALSQAGHGVTFCAAESYAPLVREAGLSYARGGREMETLIRERGESLGNPFAGARASRMVLDEQFELVRPACQGADVLIGTSVLLLGPSIAAGLRIPFYFTGYIPNCLPTGELPPPFGFPLWRRPWLNRLLWRLMGSAANLMTRRHINRLRAQLSLPAVADVYTHLQDSQVLFALDPAVGAPPADIDNAALQTGFWFLEQTAPLPAEVEAFLADGPPPIYIGFGSMASDDPAARTAALVDAVSRSGRRALISSGPSGLGAGGLPSSCLVVGSLNHQRLFPRVAAIVHHGGAGTTMTAARAGIPQVLVPHMFDQPYWAQRMHALGVAPPAVPKRFSPEVLAAAIEQACTDPALTRAATTLADKIRACDGVGAAVRFLEQRHGAGLKHRGG